MNEAEELIEIIDNDPARVVRHIDFILDYLDEHGLQKTRQDLAIEKEYSCSEELEHLLCRLKLSIIEINK